MMSFDGLDHPDWHQFIFLNEVKFYKTFWPILFILSDFVHFVLSKNHYERNLNLKETRNLT